MFVTSNRASDLYQYFRKKLEQQFSLNEMRHMFNRLIEKRLAITKEQLMFPEQILMSESDLLYVRSAVHRLLDHEPFQYIIGTVWFADMELKSDARALIPRPETEELVYWIAEHISEDSSAKMADICTGSGCIALALKKLLPHSEIFASDLDQKTLSLAIENGRLTELDVQFEAIDALQHSYPWEKQSFDLWVANPPYIPIEEQGQMQNNVLRFEPHQALFTSQNDPQQFYREIAEAAKKYLKPNAYLFFEAHEQFAQETVYMLEEKGYTEITLKEDLQGKPRMIKARNKTR